MCKSLRTFIACLLCILINKSEAQTSSTLDFYSTNFDKGPNVPLTEHAGGIITRNSIRFSRDKSPYWLRNDIIVERDAQLIIEPGVTIKVEPQVGITVRGILTAEVSKHFESSYTRYSVTVSQKK